MAKRTSKTKSRRRAPRRPEFSIDENGCAVFTERQFTAFIRRLRRYDEVARLLAEWDRDHPAGGPDRD